MATFDQERVLLGRIRRALRAWVSGRIDVDAFERITARVRAALDRGDY